MKHNTPSKAKAKLTPTSSSMLPSPTSMSKSCGGKYTIRLSGLSIIVVILSAASIALFSGRMVSFHLSREQRREVHNTCQPAMVEKMFNYEALVHPAMITHLNPTRVAVIGGKQHQTSATLGEVLKHASVKDAVILRIGGEEEHEDDADAAAADARVSTMESKGQECSVGDFEQFDVIIDPSPFKVGTSSSSHFHFNCLNDDGVLVLNTDTLVTHKDPALGIGKLQGLGRVIDALEEAGYKSVHLYQDQGESNNGGFEARSFLVALKSYESRAEWYSNEAEVNIRLHQRILRSESSLKVFDAPTMMTYQIPPKSVETAFCHKNGEDCEYSFDPDLVNVPHSDLSVAQSTMGEYSGRGLFAKYDIPKGATIGLEKSWQSYFIYPSSQRIIMELYEWADEHDDNDEDYVEEVMESVAAIESFSSGYGFWSSLLGRSHSTVDSGLMMFCNHGCNGSYNLCVHGSVDNEVDVDLSQPPESLLLKWGRAFSPALERNLRQSLTYGDTTSRDIKKGEEILCNYFEFIGKAADWEEDVRGLQGQCAGTELGDISSYEQASRLWRIDTSA